VNDPLGLATPPTNEWVPGPIVSFFFPGLGLLFLGPADKTLAFKIFGGYIAVTVGVVILQILFALAGVPFINSMFSLLGTIVHLVSHVGGMIHTHDTVVKYYPNLGNPIFFKS